MKPKDSRFNWYIEQLVKLSKNPKAKILGYSKEEFLELIDLLFGPVLDNDNKTVFTGDARYLSYAIQKLATIEKLNLYLKTQNVPPEIIRATEDFGDEMEIERTRLEARNKVESFIKNQQQVAARANVANLNQVEAELTQTIEAAVKETAPELIKEKPELARELVEEIEEEVVLNLFEAPKQVLGKEAYEAIVDQASLRIDQVLEEKSIPLDPQQKASLKQSLRSKLPTKTLGEASTLTQIDFKLPAPVQEKLPVQGTAFSPAAALFHPADLARKFTALPTKLAQMTVASDLSDEESIRQKLKAAIKSPKRDDQEVVRLTQMLQGIEKFKLTNRELTYSVYGVTSQDFQKAITFLEKELGAGHPLVRFLQIQQGRQVLFESKFPSTIKSSFSLNHRLNQQPAVVELRGNHTSLPTPDSGGRVSQAFNQIGTSTRLYQTVTEYPGLKVIRSLPGQKLADFQSLVYRKTLHPIFGRLAKTSFGGAIKKSFQNIFKGTVGKALSAGLQKARAWLTTKLGIKGLTTALGSIFPGIGNAIGFAVGLLIDKAKDLLSKFKQLITKPEFALGLGAVGGIFFIGVPGTIGTVVGTSLLALSGLGLAAGAGGILSGASAATVAILAAFFAPLGAPVGALVIGIILSLFFLTLFIVFLTASAFIIPAKPQEEISIYFRVTKTASRYQIPNEDLQNNPSVVYHLSVTAAHPVQITSIRDIRTVSCRSSNPPSVKSPITIPSPDGPTTSWQWPGDNSYQLTFDSSFKDCRVCNTVTVIANIPELNKTGEITSHTACIKIGSPPEDCPEGWPTTHGYITQGPHGSFSHRNQEAIDIGVPVGTPVYTSHEGEIIDSGGWGSDTVIIQGDCSGNFNSVYTHLQTRAVRPGNHVSRGTLIGTSGYAGTGPHLHYEFSNLVMAWPYIGTDPALDDILEGCVGKAACASPYSQW